MNQPHEPNTVMKDNDLTYKLRLGPSASRRLHEVLMADVRAVSACVRVPTAPLTGLMCKRLCAQQSTFLCRHAVMVCCWACIETSTTWLTNGCPRQSSLR
jgi:hypothetical protein